MVFILSNPCSFPKAVPVPLEIRCLNHSIWYFIGLVLLVSISLSRFEQYLRNILFIIFIGIKLYNKLMKKFGARYPKILFLLCSQYGGKCTQSSFLHRQGGVRRLFAARCCRSRVSPDWLKGYSSGNGAAVIPSPQLFGFRMLRCQTAVR